MQKGNVIDLLTYRNLRDDSLAESNGMVSEELKAAIQHLIYRLRELGPIQ